MTAQSEGRVGVVVIHGVGETEPGWINDYFIPRLLKRDTSLEFEDHSEVHSLPDLGRSRPNLFFKAYLRRAPMRSLATARMARPISVRCMNRPRAMHNNIATPNEISLGKGTSVGPSSIMRSE